MKEEIITWIREGCDIHRGVALYLQYGDNDHFKTLLSINPGKHRQRLRLLLTRLAGVKSADYSEVFREQEQDKFRKMYPYLGDYDCPIELKALAADKISTYWKCVELHKKLFECHRNIDCRDVAMELVHTFIEDQTIKQELDYYKHHRGFLGLHRIFDSQKRITQIRGMSIRELVRKERQLKDNIWRIKNEISKSDKPHLLPERQARLREKENELKLVEKMLDG